MDSHGSIYRGSIHCVHAVRPHFLPDIFALTRRQSDGGRALARRARVLGARHNAAARGGELELELGAPHVHVPRGEGQLLFP